MPRHLARKLNELYFTPQHQEFESRTTWSLSNAFTYAFKELDPIPQFLATAKLGECGVLNPGPADPTFFCGEQVCLPSPFPGSIRQWLEEMPLLLLRRGFRDSYVLST